MIFRSSAFYQRLSQTPYSEEEKDILSFLSSLTGAAVNIMNYFWDNPLECKIERKPDLTLRTSADTQIEALYKNELLTRFGGSFLGEESGEAIDANSTLEWIVDPIDGTANAAQAFGVDWLNINPLSCTSIALTENGKPKLGLITNLSTHSTVLAVAGKGAYGVRGNSSLLRQLRGNKTRQLSDIEHKPCISIGQFPPEMTPRLLQEFRRIGKEYNLGAVDRRLGTTAFDFGLVATGSNLAFAGRANIWDYLAGALIAQESGAEVCVSIGKKNEVRNRAGEIAPTHTVLAAHPGVFSQLKEIMIDELTPSIQLEELNAGWQRKVLAERQRPPRIAI